MQSNGYRRESAAGPQSESNFLHSNRGGVTAVVIMNTAKKPDVSVTTHFLIGMSPEASQ